MERNYDNENKYKFVIKYFMEYAIGSKYENKIEISEQEYKELKDKLQKEQNNVINLTKTYNVEFKDSDGNYKTQEVDRNVFQCLYEAQKQEYHRKRNENRRHIDTYFEQDDLYKIADATNIEQLIIDKLTKEELIEILNNILYEKQSKRFIKHIFEDKPLILIAMNEDVSCTAIFNSIERAKKQIIKKLKKF